jgi:2-dehydropantoate 2-reductase
VIGTTYGWQLHESGHELTLLVRPGTRARYEDGIRIHFQDERGTKPVEGDVVFKPNLVEKIADGSNYDLIMVCVRSNQVDDVLSTLAQGKPESDVLFFQNNWWGDETIRKVLPAGSYLFGFSRLVGGWRDEKGVHCILFNAPGMATMLGEVDGKVTQRLSNLQSIFLAAGLKPEINQDIIGWLKYHYVEYLGATGAILKAGSAAAFTNQAGLVRESILATREALKVCQARGVPIQSAPFNLRLFNLPLPLLIWLGQMQYKAPNIQAFFEENIRTGLEEISDQYCNVVEEGRRLNVATPVLDGLAPYFYVK